MCELPAVPYDSEMARLEAVLTGCLDSRGAFTPKSATVEVK